MLSNNSRLQYRVKLVKILQRLTQKNPNRPLPQITMRRMMMIS